VQGRDEIRDALDQRLASWLLQAGFLPVPIPNLILDGSGLDHWIQAVKPEALILSGGNDIGACPARDATESHLLSWASVHKVPVLGICRGMQMMAVWAGATLSKVEGHVRVRHQLVACPESGDLPMSVNSYHDWAISGCPDSFTVVAQSEDGAIEAIRHTELPWEGWMWHPEREIPFDMIDTERMTRLFREQ